MSEAGARVRPGEDLRREIDGSPGEIPARGGRHDVQRTAGAEIHQHRAAPIRPHDVVRLDVAVQQAGAVHRGEGPAQIQSDDCRFAGAERPLLADDRVERPPLDQFHREADLVANPFRAKDPDHRLVADLREAPRFLQGPLVIECAGTG